MLAGTENMLTPREVESMCHVWSKFGAKVQITAATFEMVRVDSLVLIVGLVKVSGFSALCIYKLHNYVPPPTDCEDFYLELSAKWHSESTHRRDST